MATGKITIASLRDLEGWLWDDRVIGFGARRQTKGVFYYLRYRRNGSQIMKSIGRHGSPWTTASGHLSPEAGVLSAAGGATTETSGPVPPAPSQDIAPPNQIPAETSQQSLHPQEGSPHDD